MRYNILDTKEIDYSFLDTLNSEDKRIMSMIFDIAKSQFLYIQKMQLKSNNFIFYVLRDNNGNYLVQDLRKNCIKFSNSKNIDRWLDINDFLECNIVL